MAALIFASLFAAFGCDSDESGSGRWEPDIVAEPGAGPGCPEPAHAPMDPSWPEVFVGIDGCDDGGDGTRDVPFCTFTRAFEVADATPYVMTVLDGTYRLVDVFEGSNHQIRRGEAEGYFVIRADEGADPVLLGSRPLDGADFEPAGEGLMRIDVSTLPEEPRGMWTAQGERMIHEMQMLDGVRSHADTSALEEPGTWTKADANGTGCPSENEGCYIYLNPPAGMNVTETDFEVSQRSFLYAGSSHFMVVRGLTFNFTHSTSIFFEGADDILLEENTFAHNANSNDNSYSVRIWNANGAIVRNNRVTDSRYWGGSVNSWGITFMVSGEEKANWVCNNEIWDIIGMGVGSKGGASNVHVVGNYIHDVGKGIEVPNSRCHWRGCDEQLWYGGGWVVRENVFVRCGSGAEIRPVYDRPDAILQSFFYNNLFVDTDRGIVIPRNTHQPPPVVRNNIFTGTGSGIYFTAGGTTTWPDYWLSLGFDSDYNVFDTDHAIYVRANWSGTEQGYTLEEYRAEYGGEESSMEVDPGLDGAEPDYHLSAQSPLHGAGDPSVYQTLDTVDIGHEPSPPN
jgi:hypothetical protein